MEEEPRLIADAASLAPLVEELGTARRVALDTEFVPEYTYFPHLCLIQVATDSTLHAIDALAIKDLSGFWSAICRDDCELVLHAGKEELLFCHRETGQYPKQVFDVQLAAGIVGLGFPLSYSKLVQRVVDKDPISGETRTDWRRRPLSSRQIDYALDDVRHLLEVRDKLAETLQSMGRAGWFTEEMRAYLDRIEHSNNAERWRRISGTGSLSPRQTAVLREIWNWRDHRARILDKPSKWVVRDDLLIELAKRQPRSVEEIQQTRGMGSVAKARWAGELIDAIELGKQSEMPEVKNKPWRRDDIDDSMIHKVISAAMVHLAAENHVAPTLLGTNDDLRQLIEWRNRDGRGTPPSLARGWRAEVCGNHIKELLEGKIALRIQHDQNGARLLFERHSDVPAPLNGDNFEK